MPLIRVRRILPEAVLVAAAVPASGRAQGCEEFYHERAVGLIGSYALVETAVIAFRARDWWPGAGTGFHFVWDRSVSGGQNHLARGMAGYAITHAAARAWLWTCVRPELAWWLGAVTSFAVALPKEVGDGLHEGFGFSLRSALWSALGAALPAVHRSAPNSRLVVPKFNYWPSTEFRNRTSVFPQLESDFAGQRYFVAFNPGRLDADLGPWPRWLGVAVGHSVRAWVDVDPVSQWYLALDLSFRDLPVRGEAWPTIATILDFFKFPWPGLKLESGSVVVGLF